MKLRDDQLERYSRHLLLPGFGGAAQRALLGAKLLCVGAGGLGSPALLYLAAAGVGEIVLLDGDVVDLSNLQRQVIHRDADLGRSKSESAREKMLAINPDIRVTALRERVGPENIAALVGAADVVLDGSDNFATRFLVGDQCFLSRKPLCHAAVGRWEGQVTTFDPRQPEAPCYRCLFPEPPPPGLVPSCSEAGVLGPVVGMLGALQATEAIKLLAGVGEPLIGRLALFDAFEMSWRTVRYKKSADCALCGTSATIRRAEWIEEDPSAACARPEQS
jgi:molybdopterin/thiamine biosynthesis adenylyltransferase